MLENRPLINASDAGGPQLREALELLERLILDGVRHGHFEYAVTCETAKMGRRLLIVRAGKSHKFSIEEGDLQNT